MTDDDLVELGEIANNAVWKTSTYQIYWQGLSDDDERRYRRLNKLRVGQALFLAIHNAGFQVMKNG